MLTLTDYKTKANLLEVHKGAASHYSYELDCLVELIQNSFKSIQQRQIDEEGLKGTIELKINIPQKKITVIDNGTGFPDFEEAIGIGSTGWKKKSPEAGFGYGLTTMIMMSTDCTIDSIDVEKKWRKIVFKNSYEKFWGTKKQKKNPWAPSEVFGPQDSSGQVKTKIILVGKDRVYDSFWSMLDKFSSYKDNSGAVIKKIDLLEQALLWHSPLGYSKILWNSKPPKIKYKITLWEKSAVKEETAWKDIGHPLKNIPTGLTTYNVKNPQGALKTTHSILTANTVCKDHDLTKVDGRIQVRIHAVSMIGEEDEQIVDKMKENFDYFPMLHYSSDRYFLSINGFNQAMRLTKPDRGGNKQIHANALFVVDIQDKLNGTEITEAGRTKLAYGILSYVESVIYEHAVSHLDKAQQGKIVPKFSGGNSKTNAKEHESTSPWKWDSTTNLGISALPRFPNDEAYVASVLSAMISKGLIVEIKQILIGKSTDNYDMLFWNNKPAEKLTQNQRKKLKINPPLKNKTHADGLEPMIGELKTTLLQFCKDIDGNKSTKNASDIEFVVCWKKGGELPSDWSLKSSKIGANLVRCSNYKLSRATEAGQPSVKMDVLLIEDYLDAYEKAYFSHQKKLETHKKDSTKPDPGNLNWPELD